VVTLCTRCVHTKEEEEEEEEEEAHTGGRRNGAAKAAIVVCAILHDAYHYALEASLDDVFQLAALIYRTFSRSNTNFLLLLLLLLLVCFLLFLSSWAVAVIVVLGSLTLLGVLFTCFLISREKSGKPIFYTPLNERKGAVTSSVPSSVVGMTVPKASNGQTRGSIDAL